MRFCACVRERSKQSQVSPKARHTRCLLLLKKSCHEELMHVYARQNAQHCSRAHAATTSCPGTLALQPPLRHCVSAPGKIWHCSHVCAAATSRPGTSALQLPLRCCILMPGKTPGAAAMCAPPPRHTWGHWRCSRRCAAASRLLAKPQRCSHVCAAATSRPGTSGCCVLTPLQLCTRRHHITPGDISAAAAAVPLHLDARKNTRCCSHVRAATTSRPGTSALQPPLRHCISKPGKMLLRWAKRPAKCPALR
jgi:hypothetical protein